MKNILRSGAYSNDDDDKGKGERRSACGNDSKTPFLFRIVEISMEILASVSPYGLQWFKNMRRLCESWERWKDSVKYTYVSTHHMDLAVDLNYLLILKG